jgi:hypothetical protein
LSKHTQSIERVPGLSDCVVALQKITTDRRSRARLERKVPHCADTSEPAQSHIVCLFSCVSVVPLRTISKRQCAFHAHARSSHIAFVTCVERACPSCTT